ncbi:MAG: methionine gamma-lyase family protein, partial [Sporolactobacillus sp.]
MYDSLTYGKTISHLVHAVEEQINDKCKQIEEIALQNQFRVLSSFQKNKISDAHFAGTTGYGYDDFGREGIEAVYA